MPRCTHKGCGQEFTPSDNSSDSCAYHSGGPVFHEGLKSWSCCSDINKPVLDFDEFMNIPPCTRGFHSDEAPAEVQKPSPEVNLKMENSESGKETYSSQAFIHQPVSTAPTETEPVVVEEEDDPSVAVPPGTKCKRTGCGKLYESDHLSRHGDGEDAVCTYHPMPPIFREGSKGYLCCKRRVLEFEEFLKIEGCKKGRHVFVPKNPGVSTEQFTDCRIDHYQTPSEVHVSVFAKQTDKERSTVTIEREQVHLDLYLPASKRFRRSLNLFGPVDPSGSSFKYYGTKVELVLKKLDTRSWTILEKTERNLGNISLTFGVGGRTGTIGAKEIVS